MYVYHGMSHEAYLGLQETGLEHTQRNWVCSNTNHMYFWKTMSDESAVQFALESGTDGTALNHSQSENLYVLRMNIPDEDIDDYPDMSAPNMDNAIAVPKSMLSHYPCEILTYEHVYTPSLAIFYLVGCAPEYLNLNRLSALEQ